MNAQSNPKRQVRVVLSTTALLSFMSVSKATALVLAELGAGLFFAVGIARAYVGESAPWFVLGACLLSAFVRAIDIESWAFFIPGGLIGRTERVLGHRGGSIATAVMMTERLLLVALCSVLCGQYAAGIAGGWVAEWSLTARLTVQELVTVGAILLIGILWARSRLRLQVPSSALARAVWAGVIMLAALVTVGIVATVRQGIPVFAVSLTAPWSDQGVSASALQLLTAFALVFPLLGGGGALGRTAREFAPPRVQSVRRAAFFVVLFVLLLATTSSFLFVAVVPSVQTDLWSPAPLSGLAQHIGVPSWASGLLTLTVLVAALLILIPAAHAALEDSEQLVRRLSLKGLFPGKVANSTNIAAAAAVLIAVVGGAQVGWLSRAYGVSVAAALLLRISVNARLRRTHKEPQPFRAPGVA
jgi:hypothetical protein